MPPGPPRRCALPAQPHTPALSRGGFLGCQDSHRRRLPRRFAATNTTRQAQASPQPPRRPRRPRDEPNAPLTRPGATDPAFLDSPPVQAFAGTVAQYLRRRQGRDFDPLRESIPRAPNPLDHERTHEETTRDPAHAVGCLTVAGVRNEEREPAASGGCARLDLLHEPRGVRRLACHNQNLLDLGPHAPARLLILDSPFRGNPAQQTPGQLARLTVGSRARLDPTSLVALLLPPARSSRELRSVAVRDKR
jgi:hypothetical protein